MSHNFIRNDSAIVNDLNVDQGPQNERREINPHPLGYTTLWLRWAEEKMSHTRWVIPKPACLLTLNLQ